MTRPIAVIPHACDFSRYEKTHERLPLPQEFHFYALGELSRRKCWTSLLVAFHSEFSPSEEVGLLVKVYRPGASPAQAKAEFIEASGKVKADLGLRTHYKDEIVLTDRVSDDEIIRLHQSCDVYVSTSHGEAWNLGGFDGMALGKTPIVTGWGGFTDYLSDAEGWLVDYRMEPCSGQTGYPGLYTASEEWADISVASLRAAMREAYEDKELRKKKAAAGRLRARDFNLQAVGNLMLKAILGNTDAKAPQDLRLVERVEPEGTGAALAGGP